MNTKGEFSQLKFNSNHIALLKLGANYDEGNKLNLFLYSNHSAASYDEEYKEKLSQLIFYLNHSA